jgi:hypothetical protein
MYGTCSQLDILSINTYKILYIYFTEYQIWTVLLGEVRASTGYLTRPPCRWMRRTLCELLYSDSTAASCSGTLHSTSKQIRSTRTWDTGACLILVPNAGKETGFKPSCQ